MNKTYIYIITLYFVTFFSNAQDDFWTLERCIEMGLQNSLEIKIRQIEVKRTQKSHNTIVNNILPKVSFDANQSYNFGSTIDPSTNGRVSSNIQYDNFFLSARMNLLDFNAIATSQLTKLNIEQAKVEKEVLENEYQLQISESYFTVLYSQELLKIQEEQFTNALQNLERIQKEDSLGSKPKSDLYDMQLSVALEEKNILETKQLLQIQKKQLFQLLNIENINENNIELLFYLNAHEKETINEASNPNLKLAELKYKQNLKRTKQVRGNNLPTLNAFYNYSTFYYKPLNQPDIVVDGFKEQFSDNKNQQVGLALNIPIFNGFRNSKNVKALKFESEKSKLFIEQEKIKINQQIAIEQEKKEQLGQLEEQLVAINLLSQKTYKTSQSKYEAGKMDAVVLSSVKNQLLQSEYNLLKNKLQLQYAIVKIKLIQQNQL
ncbi:TolC family protein [Flavobacterium sp. HNIBRBA15423]|uniref:TolC family protein n=1 Tax=Flavobacterium sp. HNIBRBA15423 TaxID=3458683 RepID=UPI004044B589